MKNPHASRWATFARGEDPAEAQAIKAEAAEAEAMEVLTCSCGEPAYWRPGVGAYQCTTCKALLIRRVEGGEVIEQWRGGGRRVS